MTMTNQLDPATDPRLTPVERDLYTRIYPLIHQIEAEHDVYISRLVAVNMVRRAVTQGADVDELIDEMRSHAEQQAAYNRRTSN